VIARIVETTNTRKRIPAAARGLWKTQSQSIPGRSGRTPAPGRIPADNAQPSSSSPTAESKIVSTSKLEASVGYDDLSTRCRAM
jgi:hypothetical protein